MIQVTVHGELLLRLDQIPQKLRQVLGSKFRQLIDEVYAKAIRQFPSSVQKGEIEHGVTEQGPSLLIGFIEPVTAKAGAIEYGGKSYYEIVPAKARLLRFLGTRDGKIVMTSHVWHPPMRGKHYIANMILHERERVEEELAETLRDVRL